MHVELYQVSRDGVPTWLAWAENAPAAVRMASRLHVELEEAPGELVAELAGDAQVTAWKAPGSGGEVGMGIMPIRLLISNGR